VRKERIDPLGGTLLLGFSALLGLNQVCIKLVNAGIEPAMQAGLRSACAFFPILLFALFMRRRLSWSDGSLIPGIAAGVLFAAEFLLLFEALDYSSVARVSVLFYTMPFWVAIAAHVLIPGERITALKAAGLALAAIGVLITLKDDTGVSGSNRLLGDVFCLLAAMGWAAIAIIARTTKLKNSCPEMQMLYQLAVSAPILIGFALWSGNLFREPTPIIWGIFAFQVIVVVAIGFLTWFWMLSVYPVANMAVYSFLAPVFGVFFGWLILKEELNVAIFSALFLIALGIVLVNWPRAAVK